MNSKILKILEFERITARLANLTITNPAKEMANNLRPSDNYQEITKNLRQTLALADILRIKGQLPLTDFNSVAASMKRLKVKANLNAQELGNILLVLTLAKEINAFVEGLDEKIKLDAILELLQLKNIISLNCNICSLDIFAGIAQ